MATTRHSRSLRTANPTAIFAASLLVCSAAQAQTYGIPISGTSAGAAVYSFKAATPALVNETFNGVTAEATFASNAGEVKPWYYVNGNTKIGRSPPVTWPIAAIATPPWSVTTGDTAACFNVGMQSPPGSNGYLDLSKPISQLTWNKRYRVTATVGTRDGRPGSFRLMLGDNLNPTIFKMVDVPQAAAGSNNKTTVVVDGMFYTPGGVTTTGGSLKLRFIETENVEFCFDNVKVEEIQADPLNPAADLTIPASGAASPINPKAAVKSIDNRLFGYNANQWNQTAWPPLKQTVQRLWDNGLYWGLLQPAGPGAFEASAKARLDGFVNIAKQNNAEVMITLGLPPQWATGLNPCHASTHQGGAPGYAQGCTDSPPDALLSHWYDYIKKLATDYGDTIKYFELWNEPDYAQLHFTSTPERMARLAQEAKRALKDADPTDSKKLRLVGPSTTAIGMEFLDRFLRAGGGQSIDIVSFHAGYSTATSADSAVDRRNMIESGLPAAIANVKLTLARHNLLSKPIWNTEIGIECPGGTCPPAEGVLRGLQYRMLMTQWANGINGAFPHIMEGYGNLWSAQALAPTYTTLTPFGEGFHAASSSFKSAKLTSTYFVPDPQVVVNHVTTAAGQKQYVLWTTASVPVSVKLPPQPIPLLVNGWNVKTVVGLNNATSPVPSTRVITLQPYQPVKLIP
jgi:Cellulase (glycosyl hydrolase family 5)